MASGQASFRGLIALCHRVRRLLHRKAARVGCKSVCSCDGRHYDDPIAGRTDDSIARLVSRDDSELSTDFT